MYNYMSGPIRWSISGFKIEMESAIDALGFSNKPRKVFRLHRFSVVDGRRRRKITISPTRRRAADQ